MKKFLSFFLSFFLIVVTLSCSNQLNEAVDENIEVNTSLPNSSLKSSGTTSLAQQVSINQNFLTMATNVSNLVSFQITHYEGLTNMQKQSFKADLDSLTDKSTKSEVLTALNMTESAFDNSSIAIYTSFNSLLSDIPTLSTLTQKDLVDVLVDASERANISGFVHNSTESWPSWICQIQYNVCMYWLTVQTELAVDDCGSWNNLGCAVMGSVMLIRGYAQCTGDYINCRIADAD